MTMLRSDDAELRLKCLAEAGAAAKLGLSHDIYQTADRYYRWVTGENVEAVPDLPFKTAVIALMEAEILGERTDIEKLREDLAEAFGIVEDKHWPKPLEIDPASFLGEPGIGVLARDMATGRVLSREETDAVCPDITGMAVLDRRMRETEDRIVQPIVDSLEAMRAQSEVDLRTSDVERRFNAVP